MRLVFVLSALILTFAPGTSFAALGIRLGVTVSADQEFKDTLSSYLLRELRQLPNVTVADDKADWKLHIVALRNSLVGGRITGYTVAIAITSPENIEWDRLALDAAFAADQPDGIPEAKWEAVKDIFEGKEDFIDLWVRTFATTDLRDQAAEMVADFDSSYLEPRRKSYQQWLDRLNERRKQGGLPPIE